MKGCPGCGRLYPVEGCFCHADGRELVSLPELKITPDRADARVGQQLLGRYLVCRVVADGGTGRVYEAADLRSKRHVALKILHPEVADDPVSVERFRREYEVSRSLAHDFVVEVVDFQPLDGGSYILVMEYLQGEELRGVLQREGCVRLPRLTRLLSQAALALDDAHQRSLIHRDLKPENLFLRQTPQGDCLKILDFGSVKDRRATRQVTVMGTTVGSPFYMSPEQAQALPGLDGRADVWALSVILYEALCGRVPFSGSTGPAILFEILTKAPLAMKRETGQDVPAPLQRVVLKGLVREPADRWASVGALADAFGRACGLLGDHRDWAITSEVELLARMDGPSQAASVPPPSVDEQFFTGMGELPSSAQAGPSVVVRGAAQMGPESRGRFWSWVALGLTVLMAAAVAAAWL